jgi:hypothetical protein
VKTARRALAVILSAALAPGCASTVALQEVPVGGREVTVVTLGKEAKVQGELLVVDRDKLWLRASDGVREFALRDVSEVRVKRHGFGAKKTLAWAGVGATLTGGGLAAACGSVEGNDSCGRVALVVGGLWLLVAAVAAPSLESSSRTVYPSPSADTLRPFARLPQGLPTGVPPTSLTSAPDPPPSPKQ